MGPLERGNPTLGNPCLFAIERYCILVFRGTVFERVIGPMVKGMKGKINIGGYDPSH